MRDFPQYCIVRKKYVELPAHSRPLQRVAVLNPKFIHRRRRKLFQLITEIHHHVFRHSDSFTHSIIDQQDITSTSSTMPPRIALPHVGSLSRPSTTIATFLVPFANLQTRSASILGSLSDNASAYSKPKRVGRGPSSGKGKTSGRGMNGQKARGKVPKNFTGGQTKESVAHGKLGFTNVYDSSILTGYQAN